MAECAGLTLCTSLLDLPEGIRFLFYQPEDPAPLRTREEHGECRSDANLALNLNPTSVSFREVLGDSETQAGSTVHPRSSGIGAVKPFKDPFLFGFWNADTIV
jgi:hypothetical protein